MWVNYVLCVVFVMFGYKNQIVAYSVMINCVMPAIDRPRQMRHQRAKKRQASTNNVERQLTCMLNCIDNRRQFANTK